MSFHWRRHAPAFASAVALSIAALVLTVTAARAQNAAGPDGKSGAQLPPVVVDTSPETKSASRPKSAAPAAQAEPVPKPKAQAKAKAKPATASAPQAEASASSASVSGQSDTTGDGEGGDGSVAPGTRSGSLGVPTTAEATAEIERTPGAVEVVPDTAYKSSTPAVTIKDALDYVPGVFVQPKWGEDSRL
ncbi:MAG: hypothetical protein ACT4N2_01110 [Hyphomicrobium sp.]